MLRMLLAIAGVLLSAVGLAGPCPFDLERVPWEPGWQAPVQPARAAWWGEPGPNTSAQMEGGLFRISDRGIARGERVVFGRGWGAHPERGGLVEVKLRAVSCSGEAGMCLLAADGVHEELLTFYPDRVALRAAGLEHRMDTTDRVHTYVLALRGEDEWLTVDGKPAVDAAGRLKAPAHEGRNLVQFGAGSSPATGEALWQSVRCCAFLPEVKATPGVENAVIYKKEGVYACFPSLRLLPDGLLVTNFGTRTRHSHLDPAGGSATYASSDGGRTWKPHERGMPGAAVLPGVRLSVDAGWKYVPEAERAKWEAEGYEVRQVSGGKVAYAGGVAVRRSTDGGKTWERFPVAMPPHRLVMPFGDWVTTPSGVCLHPVYGIFERDALRSAGAVRSADGGKTWEFVWLARGTEKLGYSETVATRCPDGRLIALHRPDPESPFRHLSQTESTDDGCTWSAPRDTGMDGYPPDILWLKNGHLLCSYGLRYDRMGIRATLSTDQGRTWRVKEERVLRADAAGLGMDLGYPHTVQLADGSLFTIYYITGADGVTHVAGTRWRE